MQTYSEWVVKCNDFGSDAEIKAYGSGKHGVGSGDSGDCSLREIWEILIINL